MKVAFFDTHSFEQAAFEKANQKRLLPIDFLSERLTAKTARIAEGSAVVCSFVNDRVDAACVSELARVGVRLIALRSAGFNHVDLAAAHKHSLLVCRVPGYSPHAVAEFAVGLLLSLNRKIHKSYARVREHNFSLDGLVGFDMHGKTVGVVGAGKIGKIFAKIMAAFGCQVLIYDLRRDPELSALENMKYVELSKLCSMSDVISLHLPLTPQTHHIIDQARMEQMKPGVLLINTGRGALIDARALITGLKREKIGGAALDVYEEEEAVFFRDLSDKILHDDVLARLLTFPNVLVSAHQAFLTHEALDNIAHTTLESIHEFSQTGQVNGNKVVNISSYAAK